MDVLTLGVPWPIVLVTCVSLCYLLLRKHWQVDEARTRAVDVDQAKAIIGDMEGIWQQVRRNLAAHQATVLRFKERVDNLRSKESTVDLQEMSDEAALVLQPTQYFNDEICNAYDEIRKQADQLARLGAASTSINQSQPDECSLDDIDETLFPLNKPIATPLSVIVFGTRTDYNGDNVDRTRHVERVLRLCVRAEDFVVQQDDSEFMVFMPEVGLDEACKQAIRVQTVVEESLPVMFDSGVAEAHADEDLSSVMTRVDAALYSARTSPESCVFQHSGSQIRMVPQKHDQPHRGDKKVRAPKGRTSSKSHV